MKSDSPMAVQDYTFRLLILGETGVGKTCVLLRFADNLFSENTTMTIGVDFRIKDLMVDEKRVKLQIWDSAGQERFRNIGSSYYRNCSGIIIVYDVTRRSSFDKVTEWISEVRRHVLNVPLIIVGNKCDMNTREVSTKDGENFAQSNGLIFVETSAKTNTNIEAPFREISRKLIESGGVKLVDSKALVLQTVTPSETKKKEGCCDSNLQIFKEEMHVTASCRSSHANVTACVNLAMESLGYIVSIKARMKHVMMSGCLSPPAFTSSSMMS
jgi:small GTP-binding protein